MPIHLPPLPRRQFLGRLLAASTCLALYPAWAATPRKKASRDFFALLADTHIAADPVAVSRKINMTEHLQRTVEAILAESRVPAEVIVAGDLSLNKGEPGDYQQLKRLLAPLQAGGIPVWLALGNHDDREQFRAELSNHKSKSLKTHQVGLVRGRLANWVILDSLEKTLSTPGLLGTAQLNWLEKTLDANSKQPTLVVVHHNPGTEANITGLKDTESLLAVLRPRKQVKSLIFGHTHRWSVTEDESGIHLINLPPVAYVFRETDPSGWVEARLRRDGMALTLRPLGPTNEAHGQTTHLRWRA